MILLVFAFFFILIILSLRKGFPLKKVLLMGLSSVKTSCIVIITLILIGCLTGLWRINGTIAYFINMGVRMIPPKLFIFATFVLTSCMSMAVGSSTAVTATAGVLMVNLARVGGINPTLVAGAVMSGVYVGDRGSPASSNASLVSALTRTELNKNVFVMARSAIIPFVFCTLVYLGLSFFSPMQMEMVEGVSDLETLYNLSWICIIPAILMLLLPALKINIKVTMIIDIIASFLISIFVQKQSTLETVKAMTIGFVTATTSHGINLSGGGIKSMITVCILLLISGTFSGITKETKVLDSLDKVVANLQAKIGRFKTMLLVSFLTSGVFCNRTTATIMTCQICSSMYGEENDERYDKMLDIADSVSVVAALVPWCIAASVLLASMDVGYIALVFAFYLYLLPVWRLINKRN